MVEADSFNNLGGKLSQPVDLVDLSDLSCLSTPKMETFRNLKRKKKRKKKKLSLENQCHYKLRGR